MPHIRIFFSDRIQVNALLVTLCLVAVLVLGSQSAASFPTYLLALAMVIAWRQWQSVFAVPLIWAVVVLLGYLVLSTVWSEPFGGRGAATVASRAALIMLFVVAFSECGERSGVLTWLGRALTLAGAGAALAALIWFFIRNPENGRLSGLGQLDNHVVGALILGAVVLFALQRLFDEAATAWRCAAWLALGVMATAIFFSGSRNAWISVGLGTCIFVITRRAADARRFVVAVTALIAALTLVLGLLVASDLTRSELLPRGDSHRLAIWVGSVSATLAENPWLGRGILTDDAVHVPGVATFEHPHNVYLAVFHQGGALGLVLMAVLVVTLIRILLRHFHEPDAKLALGLLGVALPAFVLDGHELIDKVGASWLLFWLPVGVGVGLSWRRMKQSP